MKSTETRLTMLEGLIEKMASAMGIPQDESETPKTSTRLTRKTPMASMAVKTKSGGSSKRMDDVVIENAGSGRSDGRMRIPARMFGSRDYIKVDGHKFVRLESDQNRSANFRPEILGGETGDTFTFVHEGGSNWTVEVSSGSGRRKSVAKKTATVERAKPTTVKAVKVSTDKMALVREAAKKFGLLARTNAADDYENENIVAQGTFEDDPRAYLTSRENAQAKRIWKKQAGISLKQWVDLLSKEVYG